jgi:hypothetical protein
VATSLNLLVRQYWGGRPALGAFRKSSRHR